MSPQTRFESIQPAVIEFPKEGVYRIARKSSLLKIPGAIPRKDFSNISKEDLNTQQGNRFDLADEGILYCASEIKGSLMEVLAHFRVNIETSANLRELDVENFMSPGSVPAAWRMERQIWKVTCESPLYFFDLSSPDSFSYLDANISDLLLEAGLNEKLDVSIVRGSNRNITRIISNWVSKAVDQKGKYLYSGIRHFSKRGEFECWAIFEKSDPILESISFISEASEEVLDVAKTYGLKIY
jgi:hypothetical protein